MNGTLKSVVWILVVGLALYGAWRLWRDWTGKAVARAWENRRRIGFQVDPEPPSEPALQAA
jgi:hypothetical protein